jgi:uncharacterized protein YndB with AHSA1/START domain
LGEFALGEFWPQQDMGTSPRLDHIGPGPKARNDCAQLLELQNRRHVMRTLVTVVIASLFPLLALAQEVTNTSYMTSTGEKVLRIESTVPAEKREVWKLFATADGLRKWAAPVVQIDLRTGGEVLTNYDKTKAIGDAGTIHLPIINYLEEEMITFKVKLNEQFPASVRSEDGNLQEIVQLVDLGGGRTRIVSSMIGWGRGDDWDKTYAFFAGGNKWTYEQLVTNYRK